MSGIFQRGLAFIKNYVFAPAAESQEPARRGLVDEYIFTVQVNSDNKVTQMQRVSHYNDLSPRTNPSSKPLTLDSLPVEERRKIFAAIMSGDVKSLEERGGKK